MQDDIANGHVGYRGDLCSEESPFTLIAHCGFSAGLAALEIPSKFDGTVNSAVFVEPCVCFAVEFHSCPFLNPAMLTPF